MGYPSGHKEKIRQVIISAAQKLWKSKGYSGASVDAVMNEAGLTRGGFYAHFKSKDDLLINALEENKIQDALKRLKKEGVIEPDEQRMRVIEWYLSQQHRDHAEDGCPLTALTQESPRLSNGPQKVVSSMIKRFAEWLGDEKPERNSLAVLSLMVGAITLSRAVNDQELSDEILIESKNVLNQMIEHNHK